MMSKFLLPIGLQLLGIIIILAEFILPSAGMLTVASFLVIGYSLYVVFTTLTPNIGFIFICFDIILIPILILVGIKIIAKSPITLKYSLSQKSGVISQDLKIQELIGQKGIVVSDLRPAGRVLINDTYYDVVSEGDYLLKDTSIVVTMVNGNRIVVKKLEQ